MRQAPKQAELWTSPYDGIRRKIGIAMVGLMGSSAVPACKISVNLGLKTCESARIAALDKNNYKFIHVTEADAIVILGKKGEGEKTKIEGMLDISRYSPLHTASAEIREYDLPADARPWTKLVAEPSGRISLRIEGNKIALEFKCENLRGKEDNYCSGDETDPEKLDKEIAITMKNIEAKANKKKHASHEDSENNSDKKAIESTPSEIDVTQNDAPPVTGQPDNFTLRIDIDAMLRQLEPALKALSTEDRKKLAHQLAGGTKKLERAVEKDIKDYERNSGAGKFIKAPEFLIATIKYLLANKPETILEEAKKLGVELVNLPAFKKSVNDLRAEKNLPALSYGKCAQKMAEYWATQPGAPAGGHEAGGETPNTRLTKFGCASVMVENVSWPNSFDAAHIFQQWKDSSGHRANMENDRITELGLHCVKGTGVKSDRFCVMVGTTPKKD